MKRILLSLAVPVLAAGVANAQSAWQPMPPAHNTNAWAIIVSGEHESNTSERRASLFDNNTGTKWLARGNKQWVVYQFPPGDKWAVTNYVIGSANDSDNRDPRIWHIEGSNDLDISAAPDDASRRAAVLAATWDLVHAQTNNADFPARNTLYSYSCGHNTKAYNAYRWNILQNGGSADIQASEWRMHGHSGDPDGDFEVRSTDAANVGVFTADASCALIVNAGSVALWLDWGTDSAAFANGGSALLGVFGETTNLTAKLSGLMPDTLYYFRHRAVESPSGAEAVTSKVARAFTTLGAIAFPNSFAFNEEAAVHAQSSVSHFGAPGTSVTLWFGDDSGSLVQKGAWPLGGAWSDVAGLDTCHTTIPDCEIGKVYFYQFRAAYVHGGKAYSYETPVKQMLTRAPGAITTLYWGGGTTDIAHGTPLPEVHTALTGTWDLTTKNWATDAYGTQYVAWHNSDLATAVFPSFPQGDCGAVVTLAEDIVVNKMRAPLDHPLLAGWNHYYQFRADSHKKLELAGEAPEIYVGAHNYTQWVTLGGNVELVAKNGFLKSGVSRLVVERVADEVRGQVVMHGAADHGLNLTDGNPGMKNADEFFVHSGSVFAAQLAGGGVNDRIGDSAVVRTTRSGVFRPRGNAGNQEHFGELFLDSSGSLDLNTSNTAEFYAASVRRGVDGTGLLYVNVPDNETISLPFFILSGAPREELLPWASTRFMRPVQLNASGQIENMSVVAAPSDVTTWVPGTRYRLEAGFQQQGLLNSMTIESLSLLHNTRVLTLGDHQTLNISSGLLANNSHEWGVLNVITNGNLTTSGGRLHIHSTGDGAFNIFSALTGTMDVVKGGGSEVWLRGTNANSYAGTTYVNHGALRLDRNLAGGGHTIPGNIVVNRGGTISLHKSHQVNPLANVLIREGGAFQVPPDQSQFFTGVVTLEGGSFEYQGPNGNPTFNNPGTGIVFANGGRVAETRGEWFHPAYLFTDVLCKSSSSNQAFFATTRQPPLWGSGLHLTAASSNPDETRVFDVQKAAGLAPGVSDLVMNIQLQTAAARPAHFVKNGGGAMAFNNISGLFRGTATVNAGTLRLNAYAAQTVLQGTTTVANTRISVPTTEGLYIAQPVLLANNTITWVENLPSPAGTLGTANTVQLSTGAGAVEGKASYTFLACGPLGYTNVALVVNATATLAGNGGHGGDVTIQIGGTLAPEKIFHVGGNLELNPGASWQVSLPATGGDCDIVHVAGDIALAGTFEINYPGAKRPKGVFTIATFGGSVAGRMSAPQGCSVRVNAAAKTVEFHSSEAGTLLLVR